ncbi:MAG: putative ATPase [Granulosicoccus sp.]|jgi:predicted ATPase
MSATRTPVLHHDGRDLAAALQTILEIGNTKALAASSDDAFPGSKLKITANGAGQLVAGLPLGSLGCAEWSDGTLRYILLVAALLTLRPPPLMVLNEPETSLHPDLIPPARLVTLASQHSQVWVISHSRELVRRLEHVDHASNHVLEKTLGRTIVSGLRDLDAPAWRWS